MLGVSDQETGRFGWSKRTTVFEDGNKYYIQDPTDVKMKGKVIVIVFESDDIVASRVAKIAKFLPRRGVRGAPRSFGFLI